MVENVQFGPMGIEEGHSVMELQISRYFNNKIILGRNIENILSVSFEYSKFDGGGLGLYASFTIPGGT